ncbi:MAG TPA: PKD domain-containing protein [Vicinamibacterales bacterium]
MTNTVSFPFSQAISCALLAAATVVAGCDKAQLLAPTRSSITISAGTLVLPPNGTTEITAIVSEQAGTPVQNGTTVTFSATVGRVDPVQSQTRNGMAVTTFFAGNSSGVALVRALSGAAAGGEGNTNQVEITVGAAAVETVTLRANPGSVGPSGGAVDLIATVTAANGQALQGIGVTFSADQGSLSSTNVITDTNGEARTQLTTGQQAVVSATAGTKTSSNVTVAVRPGPIVSITCALSSGTGNCAAVPPSATNNTATVLFTVTKPSGGSTLRTATIDFGDGSSQSLGSLSGGTATTPVTVTIPHTYTGPSGSTPVQYTATVQATDVNGESTSASTTVIVIPRSPLNVTISASKATATASGQAVTFTVTAKEGTSDAAVESYSWDFGDGESTTTSGNIISHVYETEATEQRFTVSVTVRTPDGRTATGRTEVLVDKFP